MRLLFLWLTLLSFTAQAAFTNVNVDGNIASTSIETMNGGSVPLGRNKVLIDTDQDNLLVNGGFEAQDVTLGWTKSVNTSIDFIDTNAFEGKKSRAIRFGGTVANYRTEANRPEYVGRQARAEIYYKSDITWGAEVPEICVYAGTASNIVSGTCEPLQNTGTQWYPYQKGFFWSEAVMGLVIRNNGAVDLLNYVYLDKASIKLDKNEGFVANIEGDWHQLTATSVSGLTYNLSTGVKSGNASLFSVLNNTLTAIRDIEISVSAYVVGVTNAPGGYVNVEVALSPSVLVKDQAVYSLAGSGVIASVSEAIKLNAGQTLAFVAAGSGVTSTSHAYTILAKARSQVTVFPDETFSTDINPVYWKATACGETEIGCYNTYSYTANTNTRTLCATRPTQTDADMRVNGPRIYIRPYSGAGTCGSPTRFEISIGKDMGNPLVSIFKNPGKSIIGQMTSIIVSSSAESGMLYEYDASSGKLLVDAGLSQTTSMTNRLLVFSDSTFNATSGYLHIKASKTGLGMANVPARYPVKFIESGSNWATVYSDGWVEQRGSIPKGATANYSETFPVPFRDSSYTLSVTINSSFSGTSGFAWDILGWRTKTTSGFTTYRDSNLGKDWISSGWGASSVVKQYGADPKY